ncbi:MAG: alpha-1,4-glucan--maltose-1-phosphate maltosyltransferase [Planctomycetaceae bacterium]|nr:alpha-1,4-glucan--maltose-1-phosphate maltosyltransferase [Planctomycetaceae bacterium]
MTFPKDGRCRVVVERISPEIDAGRFSIKRVVGDTVRVEVDAFVDGHDEIRVVLLHKRADETHWHRQTMQALGNDRWLAEFTVDRMGHFNYTVEASVDRFRTWRHALKKRLEAEQDVSLDRLAGEALLSAVLSRADKTGRSKLTSWLSVVRDGSVNDLKELVVSADLLDLMDAFQEAEFPTRYPRELTVWVDRPKARFSTWYELFPRSATSSPSRHGTFRDVIDRLPYVHSMGFDVLYLPPVSPIGTSFRKGKNNALTANPDDVGSPWAIGAVEGGHTDILPALGTLADFHELVQEAGKLGIDVALDIAFQCAPEHPWVTEHPEWFRKRPDGSIQYAENPPKKYQDIYPLDFESSDWKGLWKALKEVFESWIERGVTIFRVDNPHTKAFPFWEWCIAELRKQHPETLFLAEAFTRPKVMYQLAKLGFSQSYTYFAWRHTAWDLREYLTELTTTEVHDYFRPNFWPNTPDILTEELQHGGRAAFQRRLVLAATLTANYGIYGPPFEHCWSAPREPGSEEYLDSEKYQIRTHDLDRPDSLRHFIARVNRIRRENPALQTDDRLVFHDVDNPRLLCYSKSTPCGANTVLVVVNLDSHNVESGFVQIDLAALHLTENEEFLARDLLNDQEYIWRGSRNYVELSPFATSAHIFQIRRRRHTTDGEVRFD